ncbi:MAG: tRNA pseudouridine(13) synthase TruD, partial [Isosphaeraceae bacterium]
RNTQPDQRVMIDMKVAILAFPRDLQPRQRRSLEALPLPLPSARTPLPDEPLGPLIGQVLEPFQLSWNDLRVRHLKDVFLSKGTRLPLVSPENLEFSLLADELHAGRQALKMAFELGKGSYATILVKRIIDVADQGQ